MPFEPGVSGNPGGRPSYAFTHQRFVDRCSYLMEKYDIDQILDLATDNKKLAKACSYNDAIIVKRMARALEDDKTMERMLDRLLGKSVTRIGGENPGEGIKIQNERSVRLESLDPDMLETIASALREAREKQLAIAAPYEEIVDNVVDNGDETSGA